MFPLRPKWDWGPAATDVRQIASISGTYELPFGPQRRFLPEFFAACAALTEGWSISTIVGCSRVSILATTGL